MNSAWENEDFFKLHSTHAATPFVISVLPPLATGTKWSVCQAPRYPFWRWTKVSFLEQKKHSPLHALKIFLAWKSVNEFIMLIIHPKYFRQQLSTDLNLHEWFLRRCLCRKDDEIIDLENSTGGRAQFAQPQLSNQMNTHVGKQRLFFKFQSSDIKQFLFEQLRFKSFRPPIPLLPYHW